MTTPADHPHDPDGESRAKGFRARKREDHALLLIRDLLGSLGDLPRVRELMRELGRYYDPVLGGAILEVRHQRAIVEALEAGRAEEARMLIQRRYDLYVQDRAHLGRGEEPP
jgi:DNA-binding GntR family transcriptional regulator